MQQLKSGFKRTVNKNKYQSKVTIQVLNPCLYYLINPSFERVNKLFVLLFEKNADRTVHTKYYLPTGKPSIILLRSMNKTFSINQ